MTPVEISREKRRAYQARYQLEHKEANKEADRLYRLRNREKRRLAQRKYRSENLDMIIDKRLRIEYGITLEQYRELFGAQGSVCAICKSNSPGAGKAVWHTDHCHVTQVVRGILCHNCNVMLGHAKENVEILNKAIAYLAGGKQ